MQAAGVVGPNKSLAVRYLPLTALKPAARNARTHSSAQIAQLVASIREFGWTNPILIDENQAIVAGHGRCTAAIELGMDEVPTIALTGLSAAQKRALVLADNQIAMNAGWDADLLRMELQGLGDDGFDISLIGFSDDELAGILDTTDGLTDPDDAPEVQPEAVSRLGDLWLLGRHRLLAGDCTDAATVVRAMGGAKPHLMVTDPPYGTDYDAGWRVDRGLSQARRGAVTNDNRADWREAWALSPGPIAYVWHAGLHARQVVESLEAANFEMRAQIIWNKGHIVISRGHYHFQHEPCWYAVRKGSTAQWVGGHKQSTVWDIPKPHASETGHSTQKPVECMRRPIENNSRAGDAVYDPFVGSGTTIIAAEMTGRACIALEIAPQYVDVACRRWMNFVGKDATLDATGQTFEEVSAERGTARAA